MSPKILVVDDDAAFRKLLTQQLSAKGYHILVAANGEEALEKFMGQRPDLVLLDVEMPGQNGFEVCQMLKQQPDARLTPVVLVTGLKATEDRIRGINAGADDFLSKPVDRNELFARVRSLVSLKAYTDELERAESVVLALARGIEGKDPYTEGHCERLSDYSMRLGLRLGLPEEEITALRRAGIVHDVGKVAVPDAILLKPGRLTEEEWAIMRQHPVIGERICAPLKSFRLVLPVIRQHHERANGTGYPDGLKAEQVALTARILQIVDVYDALTTERPYKAALSREQSLATMESEIEKGWWDPRVFAEFRKMMTEEGGAQR